MDKQKSGRDPEQKKIRKPRVLESTVLYTQLKQLGVPRLQKKTNNPEERYNDALLHKNEINILFLPVNDKSLHE